MLPLHLAVEYGDVEIAESLLRTNDVDAKEPGRGRTALHLAVKGNDYEMAQMLLMNRANVNLASTDNLTALYIAIGNRCTKMVALLILHGADVNPSRRFCGKTPLRMSAEYNSPDIMKMLLQSGASIDDASTPNTTIFDLLHQIDDSKLSQTLISFMRQNQMKMPPLSYLLENKNLTSRQKDQIKMLHNKYPKYHALLAKIFTSNTSITIQDDSAYTINFS